MLVYSVKCFLDWYWSLDLLCLSRVENYLGLEQTKTLWSKCTAELLTILYSGVEPGIFFIPWLPRKCVRRAWCLKLGCRLSLEAVDQFAVQVSVPISIPGTATFPGKIIFTYSLVFLLKLFSCPTGNSWGPKVEVGRQEVVQVWQPSCSIQGGALVAVGGVICLLLGTLFFPLCTGGGITTRLHHSRVKVWFLTASCW